MLFPGSKRYEVRRKPTSGETDAVLVVLQAHRRLDSLDDVQEPVGDLETFDFEPFCSQYVGDHGCIDCIVLVDARGICRSSTVVKATVRASPTSMAGQLDGDQCDQLR